MVQAIPVFVSGRYRADYAPYAEGRDLVRPHGPLSEKLYSADGFYLVNSVLLFRNLDRVLGDTDVS